MTASFVLAIFVTIFLSIHLVHTSAKAKKSHLLYGGSLAFQKHFSREIKVTYVQYADEFVPENFDARKKWPDCDSLHEIVDQGDCSSCWAVATATTITDRWCIAYNGSSKFTFSAEDLLTCCPKCVAHRRIDPCETVGDIYMAVVHWIREGVVSNDCKPYGEVRFRRGCETHCTDSAVPISEERRFGRAVKIWDSAKPIKQIEIEIMRHGPVIGIIKLTHHFRVNAGNGIYRQPAGLKAASEWLSVKLLGWGMENGTPYWLFANGWGSQWGKEGGFFKLLKGSNELLVEEGFLVPVIDSVDSIHNFCHYLILLSFLFFQI